MAADIREAKVSHFVAAVVASTVFTSCVGYHYTFELTPAKYRTTLAQEEIADACRIVDQIALEKGMQPATPSRFQVLRAYEKDQYIFPIGDDLTGFNISLVSGGQGLEFGAGSSNSGDFLSSLLDHETLERMGAGFGKSRLSIHAGYFLDPGSPPIINFLKRSRQLHAVTLIRWFRICSPLNQSLITHSTR